VVWLFSFGIQLDRNASGVANVPSDVILFNHDLDRLLGAIIVELQEQSWFMTLQSV